MLHGVVDEWCPTLLSHRLYVSAASFRDYLARRGEQYLPWSVNGPVGDILTIDDATHAGGSACIIARELGHEVIFFVNPANIESGRPYFFSVLDAHIDNRRCSG